MKRIVILGAGESGSGAAVLAKKEGFDVFVSDMSKIADKYKKILDDHHIEWEEGLHTEEKILNLSFKVLSLKTIFLSKIGFISHIPTGKSVKYIFIPLLDALNP